MNQPDSPEEFASRIYDAENYDAEVARIRSRDAAIREPLEARIKELEAKQPRTDDEVSKRAYMLLLAFDINRPALELRIAQLLTSARELGRREGVEQAARQHPDRHGVCLRCIHGMPMSIDCAACWGETHLGCGIQATSASVKFIHRGCPLAEEPK